ncbi:gluconokinase [Aspergillus saccharolyticus JOP 1030-1]|uniref:Gluconokinase n=1 Tax=Aspergillus saccharolyticus JOP 1030-1 TaxID=1450539 RepID=A0A319A3V8_9EURO|nr:thermoresistant gluconokinase family protein [Aspergillus saccharolyticus JOP 1030-1]PYH42132.1 thermoresistant gluconokinase family protein [Aspergillus saccharolyticus JOP 1030-1]
MLSAGERPQPAMKNKAAVVDTHHHHTMPMDHTTTNPLWGDQTQTQPPQPLQQQQTQHIWVVTGPAGCGKSTVGRGLQEELGVPFLEGDDFHPASNKTKMSNGVPLTDEDRWDWLISLRQAAISALSPSEANHYHPPSGVVVACSALKKKYRDVMRVAAYGSPSVQIHFIYLKVDPSALLQRVTARQAHYMKSGMVKSQLMDLEEPVGDEWDAVTVDVHAGQAEVLQEVIGRVRDVLKAAM